MAPAKFQCSNCGQLYRWKPELVGRKVNCKCGFKFAVPAAADGAESFGISLEPKADVQAMRALREASDDLGPIALDEAALTAGPVPLNVPQGVSINTSGKCIACNSPLKPGALICVNCGANQATGQKLRPRIESLPPEVKTEQVNTTTGLAAVRTGLWITLASLVVSVLIIVAAIGLAVATLRSPVTADRVEFLINYAGFAVSALQLAGAAFCLLGPKDAGGRVVLALAMLMSVASSAIDLLFLQGTIYVDGSLWVPLELVAQTLRITATIAFLFYLRALAVYLEFQEIVEQADKVMYNYIGLIVASVLAVMPFVGCIAGIAALGFAVMGLIFYVQLILDLVRASHHRLGEARAEL